MIRAKRNGSLFGEGKQAKKGACTSTHAHQRTGQDDDAVMRRKEKKKKPPALDARRVGGVTLRKGPGRAKLPQKPFEADDEGQGCLVQSHSFIRSNPPITFVYSLDSTNHIRLFARIEAQQVKGIRTRCSIMTYIFSTSTCTCNIIDRLEI